MFRYALCPLGILATVLFCASYDVSCGNPMYNSFNYGVGLGGFTIAMKHAELVFLDQVSALSQKFVPRIVACR